MKREVVQSSNTGNSPDGTVLLIRLSPRRFSAAIADRINPEVGAILFARLKCSPSSPETQTAFQPVDSDIQIARIVGTFHEKHFCWQSGFQHREDELRQLFAQYGSVDRVALMTDRDTGRSRGFAFVEMTNTADGDKAIAELNGTQLGDRTLNVNEARPKAERGGERDKGRGRGGARQGGRW